MNNTKKGLHFTGQKRLHTPPSCLERGNSIAEQEIPTNFVDSGHKSTSLTKRLHPTPAHLQRGNCVAEKEVQTSTDESGQNTEQFLPHLERGNDIAENEIRTRNDDNGNNIEQLIHAAVYVPAVPIFEDKTIVSWFEDGKYDANNTITHNLQQFHARSGEKLWRSALKHFPFNMRAINVVEDGMYYCYLMLLYLLY